MTHADILSDRARALIAAEQEDAYSRLVVPGGGNPAAKLFLATTTPESLLQLPVTDPSSARLVLAGLWLWNDWLDESHVIAQQVETPDGSLWHAIIHRHEGDFSNSKYWLARCRNHAVFSEIASRVQPLVPRNQPDPLLRRLTSGGWNPAAFVDLVEAVHHAPDDPRLSTAVEIQRLEWQLLFAHCARSAVK